jgi:hypothetical protein
VGPVACDIYNIFNWPLRSIVTCKITVFNIRKCLQQHIKIQFAKYMQIMFLRIHIFIIVFGFVHVCPSVTYCFFCFGFRLHQISERET